MKVGLVLLTLTKVKTIISEWWALLIIVPCFIDFFTSNRKVLDVIGMLIGFGLLFA